MVCNCNGYGLWFFEKGRIPSNSFTELLFNKSVLHFNDVNLNNYGSYYCFGWDATRLKYTLARSSMIVYGKRLQ